MKIFSPALIRRTCQRALAAALLISVMPASGQSPAVIARIDTLIKTDLGRPFNGVILIARNGRILYSRSYGFSDVAHKVPLQFDEQFVIGSVSKQVTGVLVLQEAAEKHLDLQAPIGRYLQNIPQRWKDTVTVQHLLNHVSGIIWPDRPLAFKPGSQFAYSNIGYSLLGEILEKVTGKPYNTLVADLFSKAGMRNSYAPGNKPIVLKSFLEDSTRQLIPTGADVAFMKMLAPAGGIISNARDLLLWNEALHNGRILPDSLYKIFTTSFSHRDHPTWGPVDYGDGIQIAHPGTLTELGHSGAANMPAAATTCINFYYPATQTSVIVLENVSWDTRDMARAFVFEKKIRNMMVEDMK